MSDKPARIIVGGKPSLLTAPLADTLIADALLIIQSEMVKFSKTAKSGQHLTAEEGRLLNGYIKSLTELSKEQREQDKQAKLGDMSTAEILAALGLSPAEVMSALPEVGPKK